MIRRIRDVQEIEHEIHGMVERGEVLSLVALTVNLDTTSDAMWVVDRKHAVKLLGLLRLLEHDLITYINEGGT